MPSKSAAGSAAASWLYLPYAEISRALMRAHRNSAAAAAANRALLARLQDVLRRQQDLTMQIADEAFDQERDGAGCTPAELFDHAAAAVREIGEACIEAQLAALQALRQESAAATSAPALDVPCEPVPAARSAPAPLLTR
jgi:hypothetical protein